MARCCPPGLHALGTTCPLAHLPLLPPPPRPPAGGRLADTVTAVCGRTCAWWSGLADKDFYIQQNDIFTARLDAGALDPNNPFSYSPDAQYAFVLSRAENAQFEGYCAADNAAQVGWPTARQATAGCIDVSGSGSSTF